MSALDLAAMEAAGRHFGATLPAGSVVWLTGPLGAGKTTLVRAITRGRGVTDDATSPTYNLVHHYEGPRGPVYHLDCYRLRRPEDAADMDWEALLGADLLLIEWPERAGAWAPRATLHLHLDHADTESRTLVST
ncbi:MAG TPA: tRNA (adenosine(37)-N6)-threonylcarbamoyltransferase complex ATPase subunit type 1 TsaE [Gemmatimonadales bacterium]|jgi:tRNA threonylcarbamoyladenosine biosynthesis protein TsaE